MSPVHALKWLSLIPLAGAVLGCGAIEPPPRIVPHASVTFDVTVPPDTPGSTSITVVGSEPALGGGAVPGFYLRRGPDGHYLGMVRLPVDAEVSYEVRSAEGGTPEVSLQGEPMPRRTFVVHGDMTEAASVVRWGAPGSAPGP